MAARGRQRIPAKKGQPAHLKLLIRFGDALPVNKRLKYRSRAEAPVRAGDDRSVSPGDGDGSMRAGRAWNTQPGLGPADWFRPFRPLKDGLRCSSELRTARR